VTNVMDNIEKYQKQLLEQTQNLYRETPISEPTEQAYFATPRHCFVGRYREWGTKKWHVVNPGNLAEHIATLYANRPIILFGDDDENIPSTISQPSFVLRMLDLLQLKAGDKVFELGAGSGWNAALMGRLVGPEGHVVSLEIIPELAHSAGQTIESLGISNVHIVAGDGAEGYEASAPYDRAIFTAGAFDLPHYFYEQLREEGLLLMVIKTEGGGDNLFLLRKTGDHFESLESQPCGFVQLRGRYQCENLEPTVFEKSIPDWSELQGKEIGKRHFWWGGKGKEGFVWTTLGIRSFLGITEPAFRAFKTAKLDQKAIENHYFGLWDAVNRSLVVAKDDWLVTYGNRHAEERLLQRLHHWVEVGMPTAACLELKVFPIDARLPAGDNQWLVKRRDSQFLWTLQP
jgi:protein-L-isoaspartate(D-aspartate) O-methyltransferase